MTKQQQDYLNYVKGFVAPMTEEQLFSLAEYVAALRETVIPYMERPLDSREIEQVKRFLVAIEVTSTGSYMSLCNMLERARRAGQYDDEKGWML